MLVLSRKVCQSLHIGDVIIHVVRISPSRVKLGIEAPDEVQVLRSEVLERPARPEGNAHD